MEEEEQEEEGPEEAGGALSSSRWWWWHLYGEGFEAEGRRMSGPSARVMSDMLADMNCTSSSIQKGINSPHWCGGGGGGPGFLDDEGNPRRVEEDERDFFVM